MRFYKIVEDGYIPVVGTGAGGIEITVEEYNEIMAIIRNRPEPPDGYDYRLKEDLTWEEYELPPVEPVDEEEISDSEALEIITGGVEA